MVAVLTDEVASVQAQEVAAALADEVVNEHVNELTAVLNE